MSSNSTRDEQNSKAVRNVKLNVPPVNEHEETMTDANMTSQALDG